MTRTDRQVLGVVGTASILSAALFAAWAWLRRG